MNIYTLKQGDILLYDIYGQTEITKFLDKQQPEIQEYLKTLLSNVITTLVPNKILTFLQSKLFTSKITKRFILFVLNKMLRGNYIHQEIYIGNGWCMSVNLHGVYISKLPLSLLSIQDIYSYDGEYNTKDIINEIQKLWNKPYDVVSDVLQVSSYFPQFFEITRELQDIVHYNTPENFSDQELVQRIYERIGIKLFKNQEYVDYKMLQEKFKKIENVGN